jgi:hypothetical protein
MLHQCLYAPDHTMGHTYPRSRDANAVQADGDDATQPNPAFRLDQPKISTFSSFPT